MKKHLLAGFALAAALAFTLAYVPPAEAARYRVCFGTPAGAASGPKPWRSRTTNVQYSTDVHGCVLIAPAAIGDALAEGAVIDPGVIIANQVITSGATAQLILPAAARITSITIQETSATATQTGSVRIGTTAGGADVVAAAGCVAGCLNAVPDASTLLKAFSATAPQNLFVDYVGTGGFVSNAPFYGVALNVIVHYEWF